MKAKYIGLSLLLAAACSGISTQVRTAPGVDLAQFRTFQWAPGATTHSLADQQIRASLEQSLAQRGILPAASGSAADFLISYHTSAQERTQVWSGGGYPGYWGWGPGWGPQVTTYTEGTLIVDFIDPRTQRSFWRGTASSVINNPNNPDPNKIATAVNKLMEKYPSQVAATERQHL